MQDLGRAVPEIGVRVQDTGVRVSGSGFRGDLKLVSILLSRMMDSGLVSSTDFSLGGVPRQQKTLKGHLPRVMYHQEY